MHKDKFIRSLVIALSVVALAGISLACTASMASEQTSDARLVVVGALDDHYEVNSEQYRVTIKLNGQQLFDGIPAFEHGQPYDSQFSNLHELAIPFNANLLKDGENILLIYLAGVDSSEWLCWDHILVNMDGYETKIESQPDWGYSATGVEVIYGDGTGVIEFER